MNACPDDSCTDPDCLSSPCQHSGKTWKDIRREVEKEAFMMRLGIANGE